MMLVSGTGYSGTLSAQTNRNDASTLTPLSVSADTGRMAWGRQNYTSYPSAVACDRAVTHMQAEEWRTRVSDTLPYSSSGDTVSSRTRTVARTCGARFTVEHTPVVQLWSLLRVAIAADDMTKARAIIERQLSLANMTARQGKTFVNAITVLMSSPPPRIAEAQALLQRLDAMGPSAKAAQFEARLQLLGYWKLVYNTDSLRAYALEAIQRLQAMTTEERNTLDIVTSPYQTLLDLANEQGDLVAQEQLMNQALEEIGNWRDGENESWGSTATGLLETRKELYGQQTRPLNGRFWFNTGDVPRPAPGKLSLLVQMTHTCGDRCLPLYTLIRQLHARYGDSLEITLITATEGWAPGTGPIAPEEEARIVAAYFLDYKKLPVGILIDETPFTKRSDGRRQWSPTEIGSMFAGWQGANAVLIDRSSTIRWLGMMTGDRDRRFVMAAIDRVQK